MEFKIECYTEEKIAIVRFSGSLNVNDEPAIVNLIKTELLSKNLIYVIFDLAQVDYIDSAGMGSFLTARSILNSRKGELVLINPSAKIDKILGLAGFNKIFKIFYSEAEGRKNVIL